MDMHDAANDGLITGCWVRVVNTAGAETKENHSNFV
jgi:hypothetical protein